MADLDYRERNHLIEIVARHPSFQDPAEREAFLHRAGLDEYMPHLHLQRETAYTFADKLVRDLLTFGPVPVARFLRTLSQTLRNPQTSERRYLYDLMFQLDIELPAYGTVIDLNQVIKKQESAPDPTLLRPTAFFKRGLHVSKSVARLTISGALANNVGTGFLVGTSLLLTNHHVVPDAAFAARTLFRFNYEFDEDEHETIPADYHIEPNGLFMADEQLDYALIELAGRPGDTWEFLPLQAGIALDVDDRLNIIQHAGGQHKSMACMSNRLVAIEGADLVYATPTDRGSSGAPVFNDQWEVVGLHFQGEVERIDDIPVSRNRGKRIDAILQALPKHIASHINH